MNKMSWKNNAKCSVLITVNLDAEYFWLSLSPDCIDRPKTLSMGQYGMTRGLPRLLYLLDKFKIKATFFVPGKVAEIYNKDINNIIENGHEVAVHGYEHENFALMGYDKQKDALKKGIDSIKNVCGITPAGFRAPEGEITLDTLEIAKELGIKYSSNLSNDDRPYKLNLKNGSLLEIPIHWALYDFPYFAFNYTPAFPTGQGRIANYTQVLNNWIDEFEGYYENSLCYVLQLDPQTIGTPGRICLLEELFEKITKKDVWFAKGIEMYDYLCEI